mmetsp:Transcript_44609/g.139898  ORF Transcript_44609/g.139898 Transcript_44609/m.139898 type:complete len:447 (-) Transcript_44609:1378-2718(-)
MLATGQQGHEGHLRHSLTRHSIFWWLEQPPQGDGRRRPDAEDLALEVIASEQVYLRHACAVHRSLSLGLGGRLRRGRAEVKVDGAYRKGRVRHVVPGLAEDARDTQVAAGLAQVEAGAGDDALRDGRPVNPSVLGVAPGVEPRLEDVRLLRLVQLVAQQREHAPVHLQRGGVAQAVDGVVEEDVRVGEGDEAAVQRVVRVGEGVRKGHPLPEVEHHDLLFKLRRAVQEGEDLVPRLEDVRLGEDVHLLDVRVVEVLRQRDLQLRLALLRLRQKVLRHDGEARARRVAQKALHELRRRGGLHVRQQAVVVVGTRGLGGHAKERGHSVGAHGEVLPQRRNLAFQHFGRLARREDARILQLAKQLDGARRCYDGIFFKHSQVDQHVSPLAQSRKLQIRKINLQSLVEAPRVAIQVAVVRQGNIVHAAVQRMPVERLRFVEEVEGAGHHC